MQKQFFENEEDKKEFKKEMFDFLDQAVDKPRYIPPILLSIKALLTQRFSRKFMSGLIVGTSIAILWYSYIQDLNG